MIDTLLQDLHHALRTLRRSPGFTVVAVLTLALGIGANSAIFTVVDSVLVRPLPVRELDRLAVLRQDVPGLGLENTPLSAVQVEELAAQADLFQAVGAFTGADVNLTGSGDPVRLPAVTTVGEFFRVFGVRPYLGRFYGAEHSTNGAHDVAVLSYGLWQRLTGGDPGMIGGTIQLNDRAYRVIGVMPPEFRYPRGADLWMPLEVTPRLRERGSTIMTAIARLAPGMTAERLRSQLEDFSERWNEQFVSDARFERELFAVPFVEFLAGPLPRVLFVLGAAVGFVLLIACANVASLQLVRATGRAREIAVRAAIGAGRVRIVRQLAVESVILALAGGLLGLWLGGVGLDLLAHWDPARQQALADLRLDGRVLAFTALISLTAAVVFGIAPALRATRVQPRQVLGGASRGATAGIGRHRFLEGSVVVQVALALVLLLGSGLLIRSLSRLLAADPGFHAAWVHSFQLSLPGAGYPSAAQRIAFFDAFLGRLGAMPGIASVGMGWALPFSDVIPDGSPFEILGAPAEPGMPERHADSRFVGGDYFRTLGIPLLGGRGFTATDGPEAPRVVLIDEQLANEFFPGEDPVGRRIRHAWGPATIVGVVGSVSHAALGEPPKATVYYPYRQVPIRSMAVVVRGALDLGVVTKMARAAAAELDPDLPIYDAQTMEQRIDHSLGTRRLAVAALGGFAGLSLLLAVIGIYGVMRYRVNQRTREIGIRLAVGAQPRDVLALVVRRGMAVAAVGLGLGLLSAFALARLMAGMLFGVSPHDPATFITATAVLAASAWLACWLPARRATRVDPMRVLE